MKIMFIRTPREPEKKNIHPQSVEPPLRIGFASSFLKNEGHSVRFIDMYFKKNDINHVMKNIRKNPFDFFVIDLVTSAMEFSLNLAIKIKNLYPSSKIIFVGPGTMIEKKRFLFKCSPVNLCINGEYELILKDIIGKNMRDIKKIRGISYFQDKIKTNLKAKIEKKFSDYSLPDHSIFLKEMYISYYPLKMLKNSRFGFIEYSRGCPYKCLFCSPSLRMSYGSRPRYRKVKNIIKEIKILLSRGVNVIKFVDDEFILDKEKIKKLCNEIIKNNIKFKWMVQTRADSIDKDIVTLMKKAGCSTICMGVESGNDRVLKILNKKENRRDIIKAFNICKNAGLLVVAFFMLGNPTETKKDVIDSMKLCRKISPHMLQVGFFTPYPGSEMYSKLTIKEKKRFNKFSHYNEVAKNFSKMKTSTILKLQKRFYKNYYLSFNYIKEAFEFFPYLITNIEKYGGLLFQTINFLYKK